MKNNQIQKTITRLQNIYDEIAIIAKETKILDLLNEAQKKVAKLKAEAISQQQTLPKSPKSKILVSYSKQAQNTIKYDILAMAELLPTLPDNIRLQILECQTVVKGRKESASIRNLPKMLA